MHPESRHGHGSLAPIFHLKINHAFYMKSYKYLSRAGLWNRLNMIGMCLLKAGKLSAKKSRSGKFVQPLLLQRRECHDLHAHLISLQKHILLRRKSAFEIKTDIVFYVEFISGLQNEFEWRQMAHNEARSRRNRKQKVRVIDFFLNFLQFCVGLLTKCIDVCLSMQIQ